MSDPNPVTTIRLLNFGPIYEHSYDLILNAIFDAPLKPLTFMGGFADNAVLPLDHRPTRQTLDENGWSTHLSEFKPHSTSETPLTFYALTAQPDRYNFNTIQSLARDFARPHTAFSNAIDALHATPLHDRTELARLGRAAQHALNKWVNAQTNTPQSPEKQLLIRSVEDSFAQYLSAIPYQIRAKTPNHDETQALLDGLVRIRNMLRDLPGPLIFKTDGSDTINLEKMVGRSDPNPETDRFESPFAIDRWWKYVLFGFPTVIHEGAHVLFIELFTPLEILNVNITTDPSVTVKPYLSIYEKMTLKNQAKAFRGLQATALAGPAGNLLVGSLLMTLSIMSGMIVDAGLARTATSGVLGYLAVQNLGLGILSLFTGSSDIELARYFGRMATIAREAHRAGYSSLTAAKTFGRSDKKASAREKENRRYFREDSGRPYLSDRVLEWLKNPAKITPQSDPTRFKSSLFARAA